MTLIETFKETVPSERTPEDVAEAEEMIPFSIEESRLGTISILVGLLSLGLAIRSRKSSRKWAFAGALVSVLWIGLGILQRRAAREDDEMPLRGTAEQTTFHGRESVPGEDASDRPGSNAGVAAEPEVDAEHDDPRTRDAEDDDMPHGRIAEEPAEAVGPEPTQAEPTQTEETEPEPTPEEDADVDMIDPSEEGATNDDTDEADGEDESDDTS